MAIVMALLGFGLTLVLQVTLWQRLRPARLVGDEAEYLGQQRNGLWVRVPLFGALMRLAARAQGGALGARMAVSAISALGVAGATGWVTAEAGPGLGLLALVLLLASAERAVLALHIWPDSVIGVLLLAFLWCAMSDQPIAAACVAALAMGIRIDGAILCLWAALLPFSGGHIWHTGAALTPLTPALIGLAALGFYTLFNGQHFGVWWPDTTITFNRRAAALASAQPEAPISQIMRDTAQQTRNAAPAPPLAGSARLLGDLPGRLRLLLGEESFVQEHVMAHRGAEYHRDGAILRQPAIRLSLRHGFSSMAVLCGAGLFLMPWQMAAALIVFTLIFSLLHTRSRYRMGLVPVMSVGICLALPEVAEAPIAALSGLLLTAGAALLLPRAARRRERG